MGYPKIGLHGPPDQTAFDDELYALVKKLKRGSPGRRSSSVKRAQELIAAGADVNQAGRPKAPLMAVVLCSDLTADGEAIFQALLEHGANPNAPVSGLSTSIAQRSIRYSHLCQIAVSERMLPTVCTRLITQLSDHGADLNAKAQDGCTALDIAMWRLWQWEQWFDFQRVRGQNAPFFRELELGFNLLTCARPFISLVETVMDLGGLPSLWTEDEVTQCLTRVARIRAGCMDARNEALAKAAASGMDVEEYFVTTRVRDARLQAGFAQMDVGEPTIPSFLLS